MFILNQFIINRYEPSITTMKDPSEQNILFATFFSDEQQRDLIFAVTHNRPVTAIVFSWMTHQVALSRTQGRKRTGGEEAGLALFYEHIYPHTKLDWGAIQAYLGRFVVDYVTRTTRHLPPPPPVPSPYPAFAQIVATARRRAPRLVGRLLHENVIDTFSRVLLWQKKR